MLEKLRNKIQEEYNDFVEEDAACELSEDEINESFWSDAIVEFNDKNPEINVGFEINNGIITLLRY